MKTLGGKVNHIDLTIIVPVYNTESYLNECLDSICNISKMDYEIILINDGSKDDSQKICESYTAKYPDVFRLFKRDNKGLSASRNFGINKALGKYIYFLDSDDYINADNLYYSLKYALEYDLDILLFDGNSFFDDDYSYDRNIKKIQNAYKRKNNYTNIYTGEKILKKMFFSGDYYGSACLYISKANHLKKKNLAFIENIIHEDEHFTPINLINALKVTHLNKIVLNRRLRVNSIMTNLRHNIETSKIGILTGLNDLIKKNSFINDFRVYRAIILKLFLKVMMFDLRYGLEKTDYQEEVFGKINIYTELKIYQLPTVWLKYLIIKYFPKLLYLVRIKKKVS